MANSANHASGAPLEEQLRLLLSWQFKAAAMRTAPDAEGDALDFDRDRFETLAEYAETQLSQAEERLRRWRAQREIEAAEVHQQLSQELAGQGTLMAHATAGKIAPEAANSKNREYIRKIDSLREGAALLQRMITVRDAQALGGVIDLPLPEYEERAPLVPAATPRPAPSAPPPPSPPAAAEGAGESAWFKVGARDYVAMAAAAVVLLGALTFWLYQSQGGEGVVFEASMRWQPAPHVALRATNNTRAMVLLNAPWPLAAGDTKRAGSYGIEVWVRGGEDEAFALLPSGNAWRHHGSPTEQSGGIELAPHMTQELELHLNALRDLPGKPYALRIRCSRWDGAELYTQEIVIP